MSALEKTVLSVSAVNDFVKRILDSNPYMSSVNIKGEISNFVDHYKTGHLYFSIKDEASQLKCVMFSSNASKLKFKPENGMKIVAHGRISVFARDGIYVFYVDRIEPDGIGDLYLKYEQLKEKLSKEGLFDPSKKKSIPKFPTALGIITSETGAAVRDIINVAQRRFPMCQLVLYPSLVQGVGAEDDLCKGIAYFSKGSVDTIIIGRGGGSIEDLWAFNSEKLARRIAACPVPVISAVGHETDFTICDFVSDLRAPTPSAAAELAVPDADTLKRQLGNVSARLTQTIVAKTGLLQKHLDRLSQSPFLSSPAYIIDDKRMYLDKLSNSITTSFEATVNELSSSLLIQQNRLVSAAESDFRRKQHKFAQTTAKLEALNPMSVISRGYSAVFSSDGKLIKSVDDVEKGSEISFKTTDGSVKAQVLSKRRNSNVKRNDI